MKTLRDVLSMGRLEGPGAVSQAYRLRTHYPWLFTKAVNDESAARDKECRLYYLKIESNGKKSS